MITAKLITDAWAHCRTTNNSIPDEVLDFMKDISLAALHSQNSGKPFVSGSLPLTEQEIDCAFKDWESKNKHLSDTDSWSFKNGAFWAENRVKGNDR